jgi:hypothetical protein
VCDSIQAASHPQDALINFSTGVFMKKSTLALSIAAAIGSLGLAGVANATMAVNAGGVGHQLVFPYFTAQGGNATLMTITNTDTTNGKLVKVRFRGAANSDDLFDFTLALSPGDVWTAAVTQDATTGLAKLETNDKSCTLPASVNANFSTFRLDPSATAANQAAGTREGYAEVITMGNIAPLSANATSAQKATALFTTIKHVAGVAPCSIAVLTEKLSDKATGEGFLEEPTSGITGDWVIMNQTTTAAWSGSATALSPTDAAIKAFWPQTSGDVTGIASYTADPLLTKSIVTAQIFDLPDMSTPYSAAHATPKDQADATTAALAKTHIINQYVTFDGIAAETDLLFAQPTRRYHVAVNYTATATNLSATTGALPAAIYRNTGSLVAQEDGTAGKEYGSIYYRPTNMGFSTASPRTLCLNKLTAPGKDNVFDREETTPAVGTTSFTISPIIIAAPTVLNICGEAAVVSINAGGVTGPSALSATVARNDITYAAAYTDGWLAFSTLAADGTSGLPILGQSFIRLANGPVNYGVGYAHKSK